jgi:adenylosuccinate lyase
MIPRYSRPEMNAIWSMEQKFARYLEVEILACAGMEKAGRIPAGVTARIREKTKIDLARIDEIEKDVKHDVVAFLTAVGETVGDDARYLHLGLTSSDVIDTAFATQLRDAGRMIAGGIDSVLAALKKQIDKHKRSICIGRSHGIHAEPTTFGLKLAGHHQAFVRARRRLDAAIDDISVCALSGAVGTYASVDPVVEAHVAEQLGLKVETVSTQIIPRDRHAAFFAVLALLGASIENLVTEIRHLQRSEVREVEEHFAAGQKGSSAMPHKRNPVLSENLTGIARLLRAAVIPALENVTLWHERDISHSSVERVNAPDATILADFALSRLAGLIDGLIVYPERMKKNIFALNGLVFSQSVLLALVDKGMPRDEAYKIVQGHAMKVWDSGENLIDRLKKDAAVMGRLRPEVLDALFDPEKYLNNVDKVFARL